MDRTFDSLLEMARGAILERVDKEAEKIWENIHDPNTEHKAKRSITLKLIFQAADEDREVVSMQAEAVTKLAPMRPVPVNLWMTTDENGCPAIVEVTRQTPGQIDMSGSETPEPKIVQLSKERAQGE